MEWGVWQFQACDLDLDDDDACDWFRMANQRPYHFEPFKVVTVPYRGADIPRPRSGHRIASDDCNFYLFGGFNPRPSPPPEVRGPNPEQYPPTWSRERPLFRELWSYSIATRKWKEHRVIENMPEELASNAMCMYRNFLMIFGGTGNPFGNQCSNDVIVWKTERGDAKLKILDVTGAKPPGLYGQAVLAHDHYFYTIGGTNGYAYNCDIYRLDLRTMVWEPLFVATGQDVQPRGRYRHEVAMYDNKLYVIGGGTGDWAFELMEIPTFDLKTKSWEILTAVADVIDNVQTVPLPRKCHSAVQIDVPNGIHVFVTGGTDGQSVFDQVWRLHIPSLQWTLMQKTILPQPLYFHSSTVTPSGCMFVFGGIVPMDEAQRRNNTTYRIWVRVPKLIEMCWEAVQNLYPAIDEVDRETLLNTGIPVHLVDRVHQS